MKINYNKIWKIRLKYYKILIRQKLKELNIYIMCKKLESCHGKIKWEDVYDKDTDLLLYSKPYLECARCGKKNF